MCKSIILPIARQDIKEAAKWYNDQKLVVVSAVLNTHCNPEIWKER